MSKVVSLQAKQINKRFHDPVTIHVLKDVTFSINSGEFVSVVGKSGCGKSTLLYILSTMDTDYEGDLIIGGESMRNRTDQQLAHVRNEKIGFVFQFHYLLSEFTVLQNVMLPGLKLGKFPEEHVREQALDKLDQLGIKKLADKSATQISGGEKQRVSIARALINNPSIIMCDEPTGNLDKVNGQIVFDIFKELTEQFHQTLLVVTHDPDFASKTDRIIEMEDGRIIKQ
ncbi:MAG: ABC transporter ATP-binding protein [Cyclobacteriaceae bacterium]|nr:ABC transporter ATP-binding protein [Cyclobacteriaceae bacterium]